jgi:DNA-binding transcriptional ArsR family regulator
LYTWLGEEIAPDGNPFDRVRSHGATLDRDTKESLPMTLPRPIPQELAEMIAARLRVVGDPTRIRILDLLRDDELSVSQITERLQTSQQNTSKHLGMLLQAGIVARRKEGNSSIYSIADDGVYELCEQVCGGLELQLSELTAVIQGTS